MSQRIVPIDVNGFPIQTLALDASGVVKLTISGASARGTLPHGAAHEDIVRIACTTDCYIRFGDSTVVATDTDSLFTAGVEAFKVPQGATHLAAIQESAGGVMTITEMI